jgi:hypothetical protein
MAATKTTKKGCGVLLRVRWTLAGSEDQTDPLPITGVNATVDVNYGGGRVARFNDQILATNMSAGGDSGSLVTTLDDVAVGLLFAGSPQVTILNQIEGVRALLRVEVAEQIL